MDFFTPEEMAQCAEALHLDAGIVKDFRAQVKQETTPSANDPDSIMATVLEILHKIIDDCFVQYADTLQYTISDDADALWYSMEGIMNNYAEEDLPVWPQLQKAHLSTPLWLRLMVLEMYSTTKMEEEAQQAMLAILRDVLKPHDSTIVRGCRRFELPDALIWDRIALPREKMPKGVLPWRPQHWLRYGPRGLWLDDKQLWTCGVLAAELLPGATDCIIAVDTRYTAHVVRISDEQECIGLLEFEVDNNLSVDVQEEEGEQEGGKEKEGDQEEKDTRQTLELFRPAPDSEVVFMLWGTPQQSQVYTLCINAEKDTAVCGMPKTPPPIDELWDRHCALGSEWLRFRTHSNVVSGISRNRQSAVLYNEWHLTTLPYIVHGVWGSPRSLYAAKAAGRVINHYTFIPQTGNYKEEQFCNISKTFYGICWGIVPIAIARPN